MSTFKLDPLSDDLAISGNNMVIISGADEVQQLVKGRLKTFRGEWFLDTTIGLPYFQQIFVKGTSLKLIKSLFVREVLNSPGVRAMFSYTQEYSPGDRKLKPSIEFQVQTGETLTLNEAVP